jgi:acetyl-CoA carboxylase carboxyl transferase subunit alpha
MRYLEFERPIGDLERKIRELQDYAARANLDLSSEIGPLDAKLRELEAKVYGEMSPWQKIELSRHPDRPLFLDYVAGLFEDFVELHGDRGFRDDPAIIGGMVRFRGRSVVLVGHQKGKTTEENMKRLWGMPHPEGFRKAARLFQLAERFGFPVICFIDTKGAYPGDQAEERGQSMAIAENLQLMAGLKTPIVIAVTGEGGSGGALAIGVGDVLLMQEYAYYAVCTPEACASILWKDAGKKADAAEHMKITAQDLYGFGIVDEIVREPLGGAHRNPLVACALLGECLEKQLNRLCRIPIGDLVSARYKKYRSIGEFKELMETPPVEEVKSSS